MVKNMSPEDETQIIEYLTAVTTAQVDSPEMAEVWLDVLSRTNFDTAKTAIKEFASTSTEYPRPAYIGRIIARIHAERIAERVPLFPPSPQGIARVDEEGYEVPDDFNAIYLKWETEWKRLVSLGCPVPIADQRALQHVGQKLTSGANRIHAVPAFAALAAAPSATTGVAVVTATSLKGAH